MQTLDIIRAMKEQNVGMIMTTHNPDHTFFRHRFFHRPLSFPVRNEQAPFTRRFSIFLFRMKGAYDQPHVSMIFSVSPKSLNL